MAAAGSCGSFKTPKDNVEKGSSVHPAVNQMEYQVEVLVVARSSPSILAIAYPKAVHRNFVFIPVFRSPQSGYW
jgi:hypothetical protein